MKNNHIAALTGGISTGKSTISRYFKEVYNFHLVDADKVGHEILGKHEIIEKIAENFGSQTVVDGKVDRKRLGGIVFSDPQKLFTLNSITHPALIERSVQILDNLNDRPVIFEAAVLIETGWYKHFDTVILTTCSPEIQLRRTMKRNNLSQDEALGRINSQISDDIRKQHSDFIIDTSNGPEPIKHKLDLIAEHLLKELP